MVAPSRPSFWEQYRSFGIVVDAGSSGSRLQIYSWLKHPVATARLKELGLPLNQTPKVERGTQDEHDWQIKSEPGISSFASHPQDIAAYLKPLFDHALSLIPPSAHSSTPVHLLATAGMRLLPEQERRAVLDTACSFIRTNYPFHLPDCSQNVRVITGEEEGLFGWIALNYLMEGFDSHEDHSSLGAVPGPSTFGFLDMGGASTQIAFEPTLPEQAAHADNLIRVRLRLLNGRDIYHKVFVTTWLGFGTLQTRDRYVDQEINRYLASHDGKLAHDNPTEENHLGSEHRVIMLDDPCLPRELTLTEKRHSRFALSGSGDFNKCVEKTSTLLNKDLECFDEPCLFDGVHVPPIDFGVNRFVGISDYWYSSHDIWKLGGHYDAETFGKKAIEYCSQSWEEMHHSTSDIDISRLEMQCFKAAWISNILHEGIGIPKASRKTNPNAKLKALEAPYFQSLQDVEGLSVSWTLGKMVLEVSQSVDDQLDQSENNRGGGWLPTPPNFDDIDSDKFPGRGLGHRISGRVGGAYMTAWIGTVLVAIAVLGALVWMVFFSSKGSRRMRKRARRWKEEEDDDSNGKNWNRGFVLVQPLRAVSSVARWFFTIFRIRNRSHSPVLPNSEPSTSSTGSSNVVPMERPHLLRNAKTMPAPKTEPLSTSSSSQGIVTADYGIVDLEGNYGNQPPPPPYVYESSSATSPTNNFRNSQNSSSPPLRPRSRLGNTTPTLNSYSGTATSTATTPAAATMSSSGSLTSTITSSPKLNPSSSSVGVVTPMMSTADSSTGTNNSNNVTAGDSGFLSNASSSGLFSSGPISRTTSAVNLQASQRRAARDEDD